MCMCVLRNAVCMNEYNWVLVELVFLCLGCMSLRTSMNWESVNMDNVAMHVIYIQGLHKHLACKGRQVQV